MDKKAKVFLRAIQAEYSRKRTYYVMLESFWTYGSSTNDPRPMVLEMGGDADLWEEIRKLDNRYRRFCNYMREVKPGWKTVDTIHFADNSIEEVQENIYGDRRQIMVKAPGGDLCF
jgi:hypothetical protein